MIRVDVNEAKERLSELIAAAHNGETVVIETETEAIELTPRAKPVQLRTPGSARGLIWMAEDFDAPLDDFKEYME